MYNAHAGFGVARHETIATLMGAARGAEKDGNREFARELRERARRVRASYAPVIRRWPWYAPPVRVRLERTSGQLRRLRAIHRRVREAEAAYERAHTVALRLGGRTLLAMTCYGCGQFLLADRFKRHIRNKKDKVDYIDRRCVNCKWGTRVNGRRRDRDEEWLA